MNEGVLIIKPTELLSGFQCSNAAIGTIGCCVATCLMIRSFLQAIVIFVNRFSAMATQGKNTMRDNTPLDIVFLMRHKFSC